MPTGEHASDRKSDLAVMAVEEYKQKRRLERILDASDHIDERANDAWDELVNGQIAIDGKNIIIQKAVKHGIVTCYNLLLDHHEKVREEADGNGSAQDRYWTGTNADPIGTIERNHSNDIDILGLKDYLETDTYYEDKWVVKHKPRNLPVRTETVVEEFTVPEWLSWQAALRLKEFLGREEGIEIKFESMEVDEHAEPW